MLAGFAIIIGTVVISLAGVAAEGGYFDDFAPEYHVHYPESPAYQPGVTEQVVNFFRGGVCGYIKIFGTLTQQDIPYAAAYKVSLIAGLIEPAENLFGRFADHRARDVMLVPGDFPTLIGACLRSEERRVGKECRSRW